MPSFRALLRPIWSLVKAFWLISLPVTTLPFLNGLYEGTFIGNYVKQTSDNEVDFFQLDMASARFMDYFSVPGAPGICETARPPFHIVELQDPSNWWETLGLKRFDIDKKKYPLLGVSHQHDLSTLENLYRRRGVFEEKNSWHHWVYASEQILHVEGLFLDKWDEAFNDLVQYRYANPSVRSADFHFISCPGRFLCTAWGVKGPALLHFTTEVIRADESVPIGAVENRRHIPGYDAVTVRIMDLPIKEPEELGIPGIFPSHFNQLKEITSNSSVWAVHEQHSQLLQFLRRCGDVIEDLETTHPWYGKTYKLEEYLLKEMGFEDSLWSQFPRLTAWIVAAGARIAAWKTWRMVAAIFRSATGDKFEDAGFEEPFENGLENSEDNFVAQQLKEFVDMMSEGVEDAVKDTPEGAERRDEMCDLVRTKPKEQEEEDGEDLRSLD
ncbi:Fc.00g048370.m01.CDS01 [Cosmosporella sp. VM-42]